MEKFHEMGLSASEQPFEAAALENMANRPSKGSPYSRWKKARGINVVGISPGEVDEAILVGAHRDIIFSVQGAEDDGSGTAAMLELARVMSQKKHKYTYIFVSSMVRKQDFMALNTLRHITVIM
jgi:Zn-dependent M28 family amino/carboxypeptidase